MKIPKAVMMSINPEWCDLIIQGKKTVELRKSKPSLRLRMEPLGFTVYIYCTKSPMKLLSVDTTDYITGEPLEKPAFIKTWYTPKNPKVFNGRQKVIGYFTCKWFDKIFPDGFFVGDAHLWCSNPAEDVLTGYCLTEKGTKKYLKGKNGYGWHIDDLVIYEKPKTLQEFGLKRPPQSWCYVYDKVDFTEGIIDERNII